MILDLASPDLSLVLSGGGLLGAVGVLIRVSMWISKQEERLGQLRDAKDRIGALEARVAAIDAKQSTMWDFQIRRAMSEAVSSGAGHLASPLKFSDDVLHCLNGMRSEIVDFVRELPEKPDSDVLLDIEREFGARLISDVCIPMHLSHGACLLMALYVARDGHSDLFHVPMRVAEGDGEHATAPPDPTVLLPMIVERRLGIYLDTAIAAAGADMGNIQLADMVGGLLMVIHKGFDSAFLRFFRYVGASDTTACATAMTTGRQVVIEDATTSPVFADLETKCVILGAGIRAVISTPLTGANGRLLGIMSVHFKEPTTPSPGPMSMLRLVAQQLAAFIQEESVVLARLLSQTPVTRAAARTEAAAE
jgi:hypothetical protein